MCASSNLPCLSKTFPLCNRACLNKNWSLANNKSKLWKTCTSSLLVHYCILVAISVDCSNLEMNLCQSFTGFYIYIDNVAFTCTSWKFCLKVCENQNWHRWFVQKHVLHKWKKIVQLNFSTMTILGWEGSGHSRVYYGKAGL